MVKLSNTACVGGGKATVDSYHYRMRATDDRGATCLHPHLIFMCKSWYLPRYTCHVSRVTCHRIWTRICKLLSAKLNKRASFDTFPDHNDRTQWLFGRINQIYRPQNVDTWIHNNHSYSCKLNIRVFVWILTETMPRSVMENVCRFSVIVTGGIRCSAPGPGKH